MPAGSYNALQSRNDCLYFVDKEAEKQGDEGIHLRTQSWSLPQVLEGMEKYKTQPCAYETYKLQRVNY